MFYYIIRNPYWLIALGIVLYLFGEGCERVAKHIVCTPMKKRFARKIQEAIKVSMVEKLNIYVFVLATILMVIGMALTIPNIY